jgi:hypothetical protein
MQHHFKGKRKELAQIKRVKITQEFEEAHEVACLLKVCSLWT